MMEVLSQDEIEQMLEAIPPTEKKLCSGIGWPLVIDYQTFCKRLVNYGFNETKLAQAKAALIEAELAYRYFGASKKNT